MKVLHIDLLERDSLGEIISALKDSFMDKDDYILLASKSLAEDKLKRQQASHAKRRVFWYLKTMLDGIDFYILNEAIID